jgi:hypothetical protein
MRGDDQQLQTGMFSYVALKIGFQPIIRCAE